MLGLPFGGQIMPEAERRPGWDSGDWTDMPPVKLRPYDRHWPAQFEEARDAIAAALVGLDVVIEHIGSTAVPRLAARRGIDILIGLRDPTVTAACVERLAGLGYAYHFTQPEWVHLSGRGHKLHLTPFGSERWVRQLVFRDYLRANPETAAAYERVKRDLVQTHGPNGQRYVAGKTAFIEAVLDRAGLATSKADGR
jgi:GrpB-like predicted nucleotidyltransferase (UPF0157 family)